MNESTDDRHVADNARDADADAARIADDAQEVARQLRGLQAIEHIREALEDRFEVEVREAVASGADYPVERLHDYLTGVEDGHEPRVRLLFELFERDALDTSGVLADAPATCFFLGAGARYQRSMLDWLRLFGPERTYLPGPGEPVELELWSAGDLVWSRSRARAQDSSDYLTLVLDRPVGLWRATVPARRLRFSARDRWSGRDEARYVVPRHVLDVSAPRHPSAPGRIEQVAPGSAVPLDVPLTPRPRVIDEL